MDISVTNHPERERYEVYVDGRLAGFATYQGRPEGVALVHTQVLPEFGGMGVGSRLVGHALDDIRAQGKHVIPLCPFVTDVIRRHPEYADLVVDRYRSKVT